MCTTSHQARDVRDVRRQDGADFIRNRTKCREIERPWIRRRSTPDELRPMRFRQFPHLVDVDSMIACAYAIRDALEKLARNADVPAMGEMTARGQTQAHDRFARFHESEILRKVRGAARVRLHVDVLRSEELLHATTR